MIRRLPLLLLLTLALMTPALLVGCPTGPGGGDDDDVTIYGEVDAGALVITEILANPNVGRPEFIEVINTTTEEVNLQGCKVADAGAGEHEYSIGTDKPVQPGERVLLGAAEYLGTNEGEIPVYVVWSDITLAQNDELESVGLWCPDGTGARRVIDEVAFHWSGLDLRRGHAWQLVATPDAVTNDDPLNWCEAPTDEDAIYAVVDGVPDYGSPGDVTYCETPGGPTPGPGDVVISELLIDEFDGLVEWFEVYSTVDGPVDLRGCRFADIAQDSDGDPNLHVMDAELGETTVQPGDYLLLAKGALLGDSIVPDYPYGSLGFNNSDAQWLWLECPEEGQEDSWIEVDRIAYDWGTYGSDFEGRSLSLSGTLLDATANDLEASWCLALDGDAFFEAEDDEGEPLIAYGTPGTANPECPVPPPYPEQGHLVFTEVMARSAGSDIGHNEEWFEMFHVGNNDVNLVGCWFANGDGESIPVQDPIDAPLGLTIAPGDRPVFVKSSASDSIDCGLPYVHAYGTSISFNNDDFESLALWCPGEPEDALVDEITFDGGFEPGLPWQLMNGAETFAANDDPLNWCVDLETSGYTWECTVGEDTNYGTPGGASTCP